MERDAGDRGLDAEGYIRREVSAAKIAPPYTEVVGALRALYRERAAGRLHSLYLNGSVVKGTAIPGVSDLDVLALTREAPTEEDTKTARDIAAALERRYPFLSGAGILLAGRDDVLSERERYDMGFFVACLCACIDGEDLEPLLPRYRPSLDLARHKWQRGADDSAGARTPDRGGWRGAGDGRLSRYHAQDRALGLHPRHAALWGVD